MNKIIYFIGVSRCGKTVLITGTSNFLINEFMTSSIYTNSPSLFNTQKQWDRIVTKRVWPLGTAHITKFNFLIKFYNEIIDFSFFDYCGGLLIGLDPCSIKEKHELFKDFDNAGGLIFCVPADTIKRIINKEDYDAFDELEELNNFIIDNIKSIKKIPITVTITKGDLLETSEEVNLALEIIKSELDILFTKGNHITAFITLVGLDKTEKNIESMNVVFKNFHLPISFCLYHILSESLNKTLKNVSPIDMVISKNSSTNSNCIGNIRNNQLLLENMREELIVKGEYFVDGERIKL